MLQLPDLVYGPSCSTLSAVDRAIMIERELEDLADARDVELADVRIDLQEAREERDEQSHAAEELAAALDAVIEAHARVESANADIAMIGALTIPGPTLVKATETLESAIGEAKRIAGRYASGEL